MPLHKSGPSPTARIIAGVETFTNVRYRIGIAETKGRRRMTGGTIEVTPAVISSLHDVGECAIELGNVLGWFGFVVTDVHHREIKLTGWINAPVAQRTERRASNAKVGSSTLSGRTTEKKAGKRR